jgi:NADH-quinone oxidoreductase subunit E
MGKVTCRHCNYTWDYQGEGEYYATCPRCRYKVKIPEIKTRGVNEIMEKRVLSEEPPRKLLGVAKMVDSIIKEYQYRADMLIQILLKLQRRFNWLPMEVLSEVSRQLRIPTSRVYRAATFYKAFSLSPRGRNLVRVCMGTSCNVRGAQMVLDRLTSIFGVGPGETTPDAKFTLETVNCLGCCALGPVIAINDNYYGNQNPASVAKVIENY